MQHDETNYYVLLIVALVGVVALVTMSLHTTNQVSTTSNQPNLQGAATAQAPANLPAYSQLDYNADGVLDKEDASILADVIGVGGCPESRTCDLNTDSRIDEQDLALFNQLINQPIQPTQQRPRDEPIVSQATSNNPSQKLVYKNTNYPSQATTLG